MAPEELPDDLPALLVGSAVLALVLSLVLPFIAMTFLHHRVRERGKAPEDADDYTGSRFAAFQEGPRLEVKAWEEADTLPGCPWRFDGCEHLAQALDRIWCSADCEELEEVLNAIKARLQNLRVVRVCGSSPKVHFGVIYTLNTGAEVFGGQPLGPEVNVELSSSTKGAFRAQAPSSPSAASRERSGQACMPRLASTGRLMTTRAGQGRRAIERCVSCLDPLYRVHDGFASLLSPLELPALLSHPDLPGYGSCFYVLPVRGLRPLRSNPRFVGYARVDSRCVACFNDAQGGPGLVYVERTGEQILDDYHPLAFAADTLVNVISRASAPLRSGSGQDLGETSAGPGQASSAAWWLLEGKAAPERVRSKWASSGPWRHPDGGNLDGGKAKALPAGSKWALDLSPAKGSS